MLLLLLICLKFLHIIAFQSVFVALPLLASLPTSNSLWCFLLSSLSAGDCGVLGIVTARMQSRDAGKMCIIDRRAMYPC
jgi:hypothetical protein